MWNLKCINVIYVSLLCKPLTCHYIVNPFHASSVHCHSRYLSLSVVEAWMLNHGSVINYGFGDRDLTLSAASLLGHADKSDCLKCLTSEAREGRLWMNWVWLYIGHHALYKSHSWSWLYHRSLGFMSSARLGSIEFLLDFKSGMLNSILNRVFVY